MASKLLSDVEIFQILVLKTGIKPIFEPPAGCKLPT